MMATAGNPDDGDRPRVGGMVHPRLFRRNHAPGQRVLDSQFYYVDSDSQHYRIEVDPRS